MGVITSQSFTFADGTAPSAFGWDTQAFSGVAVEGNSLGKANSGEGLAWYDTADTSDGNVEAAATILLGNGHSTFGGVALRLNTSTFANYLVYIDSAGGALNIKKSDTVVASVASTINSESHVVSATVETVNNAGADEAHIAAKVQRLSDSLWLQTDGSWGASEVVALTYVDSSSPILGAAKHGVRYNTDSGSVGVVDDFVLSTLTTTILSSSQVDDNGFDVILGLPTGRGTWTGTAGFTINVNGSAATIGSYLWTGTESLRLRLANGGGPILSSDTVTVVYDQTAGNVIDGSSTELDAISDEAVSNASSQTSTAISINGITWTLATGTFTAGDRGIYVNGDPWTTSTGPFNVDPAPSGSGSTYRNGSMVDPLHNELEGFDGRDANFDGSKSVTFPVTLAAGQSIISTTSLATPSVTYIDKAQILTCVASAPAQTAFRPPYCGGITKSDYAYDSTSIDTSPLPGMTASTDVPSVATARDSVHRPWVEILDGWGDEYTRPHANMPTYGADITATMGAAMLCVMSNASYLDQLIIDLIQRGIDYKGLSDSGLHWVADGGHASGRWPSILFAGKLLGETAFYDTVLAGTFGEFGPPEGSTFYVTRADIAMLHYPQRLSESFDVNDPSADYTSDNLHEPEWGVRHWESPSKDDKDLGAEYRYVDGPSWYAEGLMLYAMGLDRVLTWPAFYDYLDRFRLLDSSNGAGSWSDHVSTYRPAFGVESIVLNDPGTTITIRLTRWASASSWAFTLSGGQTLTPAGPTAAGGTDTSDPRTEGDPRSLVFSVSPAAALTDSLSYDAAAGDVADASANALPSFGPTPLAGLVAESITYIPDRATYALGATVSIHGVTNWAEGTTATVQIKPQGAPGPVDCGTGTIGADGTVTISATIPTDNAAVTAGSDYFFQLTDGSDIIEGDVFTVVAAGVGGGAAIGRGLSQRIRWGLGRSRYRRMR